MMRYVCAAAIVASIGVTLAEPLPPTMPSVPEAGSDSSAPAPALPYTGSMGAGPGGVAPDRIEQVLRRAVTTTPPVLRGPVEQTLFLRHARSVVLIVTEATLGSGAVVGADGTILTSARAVSGAKSVGVIFKPLKLGVVPRESDAFAARVMRVDAVADLALIKVARLPADVQPLAIGDIAQVRVGAAVHAIGHPFGEVWSYTKGIVREVRRDFAWTADDGVPHRADVVQMQTPLNPSDTGGPALNDAGELIGVGTSGRRSEVSLAVASSEVRRVLAMTTDRAAVRARVTDAPMKAVCAPVRMAAKRTKKGDGTMVIFDADCNGKADTTLVVPDSRSVATLMMIDRNENGKTDVVYVDNNNDMKFDYALFDTNEDGRTDLIGYDLNDQLEPSRIVIARA